MKTFVVGLCACVVLPAVTFSQAPSLNPVKRWKTTDIWHLLVEQYPDEQRGGEKPLTFPVEVIVVAGAEGGVPMPWVVMRFKPSPDAPEKLRSEFHAWLGRDTGWLSKFTRTEPTNGQPYDMKILRIGEASALDEPHLGLPVDMLFPSLSPLTHTDKATGSTVKLTREEKADGIHMQATICTKAKSEIRITQVWDKEASWWRESIRHVNGGKTLHAKLVSVESREQLEAWLRKDINLFLVDNDQLCLRMDFVAEKPTVPEVLTAIQEVTGVRVTLHPSLEGHQPFLGNMQYRESPAWVLMKLIASKFNEAQWEHFEGGYRLKPGAAGPPIQTVPVQPSSLAWAWWAAGIMLGALALLVLFRLRHRLVFRHHQVTQTTERKEPRGDE